MSQSDELPPPKKRKLRPLKDETDEADQTTSSDGRKRTVPHTPGIWPSHVYLESEFAARPRPCGDWDQAEISSRLAKELGKAAEEASKLFEGPPFKLLLDEQDCKLHISITKELYPPASGRIPLREVVQAVASKVEFPTIAFTNFVILTNQVKTCRFLALQIGAGHAQLQTIVHQLDPELAKMHLPKYHDPPIFHASFAWRLPEGDFSLPDLAALNEAFRDVFRKESFDTTQLSLRIGSKVYRYP